MRDRNTTTIIVKREESVAFAVVTLLFYIFVYPVGLLLNLVGLLTGPRRGCFVTMALAFIFLPLGLLAVVIATGIHIGIPLIDQLLNEIRALLPIT